VSFIRRLIAPEQWYERVGETPAQHKPAPVVLTAVRTKPGTLHVIGDTCWFVEPASMRSEATVVITPQRDGPGIVHSQAVPSPSPSRYQ
jgi:hypothetical protein